MSALSITRRIGELAGPNTVSKAHKKTTPVQAVSLRPALRCRVSAGGDRATMTIPAEEIAPLMDLSGSVQAMRHADCCEQQSRRGILQWAWMLVQAGVLQPASAGENSSSAGVSIARSILRPDLSDEQVMHGTAQPVQRWQHGPCCCLHHITQAVVILMDARSTLRDIQVKEPCSASNQEPPNTQSPCLFLTFCITLLFSRCLRAPTRTVQRGSMLENSGPHLQSACAR